MKLYLDSANLSDIETALKEGVIRGITTNPSLLSKEPKSEYLAHLKRIIALAKKQGGTVSVSVEVSSSDKESMIEQARFFVRELDYPHLAVKIHISHRGENFLDVVKKLSSEGIRVNCTACMTPMQAYQAAAAGAHYVSLFYNRIRDGRHDPKFETERSYALEKRHFHESEFDPNVAVRETRALISPFPHVEIIAGSIRSPLDIKEAGLAGAHVITASLSILHAGLHHFKTDEAVDVFLNDLRMWLGQSS